MQQEVHHARSLGLSVALGAALGAAMGAATGHMGVCRRRNRSLYSDFARRRRLEQETARTNDQRLK